MREKKLIAGFKTISVSGAFVAPFVLAMTSSIENTLFIALSSMSAFMMLTFVVAFLSKWFRGAEAAVVTIGISSVFASILTVIANKNCEDIYLIIMVITFCYVVSLGTNKFSEKLSTEWGIGAAMGFGLMSVIIGLLRILLPNQPGFAFIAAAMAITASRILFSRYKI